MPNRPGLILHADKLWGTVQEQISESTILPWDVIKHGLPMGMSAIKLVAKHGTDKMRAVFVLCDINACFQEEAVKCTLQTHHRIRSIWARYDWILTADIHNSFHHYDVQ